MKSTGTGSSYRTKEGIEDFLLMMMKGDYDVERFEKGRGSVRYFETAGSLKGRSFSDLALISGSEVVEVG